MAKRKPKRMKTDEELYQIATDMLEDKVFTSYQIPEYALSNLTMIFMPLLFMDEKQKKAMKRHKASMFYEYYTEAGNRSVNGYPIFMSMRYINIDDSTRLREIYEKIKEKKESLIQEILGQKES